jgi:uncharacterized protein (TIGR03118 family)
LVQQSFPGQRSVCSAEIFSGITPVKIRNLRKAKMNLRTTFLTAATAVSTLLSGGVYAQNFNGSTGNFIYGQVNLVADTKGSAATTDPTLVDPWGLAFQPGGAFWINDRAAGVATLYDGTGNKIQPTFTIPKPAGVGPSSPTALVWNPSKGFLVPGTQLTSVFLFATLQGTIAAWAPNLPVTPTSAVTAVDNSKAGAVYTGLDFGVNDQGAFLYAANVKTGRIDVFDSTFKPAGDKLPGRFSDPKIPSGFVPFGIHTIDGNLAVTYARQNAAKTFITPAKGEGFVDIFDTNGNLVQHLAARGPLNAPWGVALAPAGFGGSSGEIIVGNFGDGHVLAFDEKGGDGSMLLDRKLRPITLPGLWSLSFGGGAASDPRTLFFTAGVGQGHHGLFGSLTPLTPVTPLASR